MPLKPWSEVEGLLKRQGISRSDELFEYKKKYFDRVARRFGKDPDDEETERKRKLFLYGNEDDLELGRAINIGVRRGLAEVPETGADIIEFGQKFIPGNSEKVDAIEEALRDEAEKVRTRAGEFHPSSLPEKVVGGLAQVPGIVGSMAPFQGLAGAAVAATPLTGTAAALATGGLGFGAYEAVRASRGSWEDIGKAGLEGAALGTILGGAARATRGVAGPVKSRLAAGGAAAAGTTGFELAVGADPEDAVASGISMGVLAGMHKNLYQKVAENAKRAGVEDPGVHKALYDAEVDALNQQAQALADKRRKKSASKNGDVEPAPTVPTKKASEIAEEAGIPFEALAGKLGWDKRFARTSNQEKETVPTKREVRDKWRAAAIELAEVKNAALEERGGQFTDAEKLHWRDQYRELSAKMRDEVEASPEYPVKKGAEYTVFAEDGATPQYRIRRVDMNRKSSAQWELEDVNNPGEKRYFRKLGDAERSVMEEIDADPSLNAGSIYSRGLAMLGADSMAARLAGRQMTYVGLKGLGYDAAAERFRPFGPDEANQAIHETWGVPLTETAMIGTIGSYYSRTGQARQRNLRDIPTGLHEIGHHITREVLRKILPREKTSQEEIRPERLAQVFTPEEMQILFNMGVREYMAPGQTKPDPLPGTWASYEAEGIAGYYRSVFLGESLPDFFYNSPAGKSALAKLESWKSQFPDVGERISKSAEIYERWAQQSPKQKIDSLFDRGRRTALKDKMSIIGDNLYKYIFNQQQRPINEQKIAWAAAHGKDAKIPAHRDLANLMQLNNNASIAQQARGTIHTGIFPTVFGDIDIGSFHQALANSGLIRADMPLREAREITRNYIVASEMVKIKDFLDFYEYSRDNAIRGGAYPKTGEELASVGELLKHRELYYRLTKDTGFNREELNAAEKLLDEYNKKHPNAKSLLEYIDNVKAAARAIGSPTRAGGGGFSKELNITEFGPDAPPPMEWMKAIKNRKERPIERRARFKKESLLYQNIPDYIIGGESLAQLDWGGARTLADPITSLSRFLEERFMKVAHNRVMNEIHDTAQFQELTGKNFGAPVKAPAIEAKIKSGVMDAKRDMLISYMRDGKKWYFQFNKTPEGISMWRSLRRTGPLFMGNKILDTVFGAPKRAMVLGTTGANAGFLLVTNPPRDMFSRSIQSELPEGRGFGGAFRTIKDFVPFLIKANLEMISGKQPGGELGQSYRRYLAHGVKGSSMVAEDIRNRKAFTDQTITASKMLLSINQKSDLVLAARGLKSQIIRHPIEFMRQAFMFSEDINRFPEFYQTEQALAKQGSPVGANLVAGKNAAEAGIDFKRAGIVSRQLNELVPFFNPSLQGLDKFKRTLFSDKNASLKNVNWQAVSAWAQVVGAPTVGLWLLNRDEEWYKELPLWEKILFWHAKIGDTVYKLPVPFEWGVTWTLPFAVADSIYNDAPERIKEQMKIAAKSLIPYDFLLEIQLTKPAWEAIGNKNTFTGIPIESRAMQRRLPSDRFRPSTLNTYRTAGKLAEALHMPETFQSPVMIEHLTRGYFGSVVHGLIADAEAFATGDFSSRKGQGLISSRITSRQDRPGQSVNDFYSKMDEMDKIWGTAKRLIKSGDKGTAAKVLMRHKNVLDMDARSIRRALIQRDPETPKSLLEMHRRALEMAELRKQEDEKQMTKIAQAALGRDW